MLTPSLLALLTFTQPAFAEAKCWTDFTSSPTGGARYTPDDYCSREIANHFARTYPDQIQLYVYGVSDEGRELYALRVTSDVTTAGSWARPAAMFVARTHGNEHSTERNVLDWLKWLVDNPSANGDPEQEFTNDWLLDNRQIWIIPAANPDGVADDERCVPSLDIDPNRDYAFGWWDTTALGDCYGRSGPWPFYAKNTRGLANFVEWVGPQIFVDVHGYKLAIDGTECTAEPGKANAIVNWSWKIYAPWADNEWSVGDQDYNASSSYRSIGDDAGFMLWRDPTNPDSLARLGEVTGLAGGGARYYYPYSDTYACDSIGKNRRGVQVSLVQAHTPPYMWARVGAVSLGHELLDEKVNPAVRWDILEGTNVYGNEGEVRAAAADARYPFNRLVELAANPLPVSTPDHQALTSRTDLAVTRLIDTTDGCSGLRTFPKREVTTYTDMLNGPAAGTHSMLCAVTNWGNSTAGSTFDLTITVDDLTNSSLSATVTASKTIAGGATTTHTLNHDYVEGHDYEVSCAISQTTSTETDGDGSIFINEDQGCAAIETEFGDTDMPDWCVEDGNHWDSLWHANNQRTITFTSAVRDETVCRGGVVVATNGWGHVLGHIPSIQ